MESTQLNTMYVTYNHQILIHNKDKTKVTQFKWRRFKESRIAKWKNLSLLEINWHACHAQCLEMLAKFNGTINPLIPYIFGSTSTTSIYVDLDFPSHQPNVPLNPISTFTLLEKPKINMPPNYLRNRNVGPKVKQRKNKWVGAYSLTRIISGVRGHVGALGWDYNELTSKNSRWNQPTRPRKVDG